MQLRIWWEKYLDIDSTSEASICYKFLIKKNQGGTGHNLIDLLMCGFYLDQHPLPNLWVQIFIL